jgi:hypothetical protein
MGGLGRSAADPLWRTFKRCCPLLPADSVRQLEKDAPEIRVALSEPVEYEAFAQGLRNTKMFISPLGCGAGAAAAVVPARSCCASWRAAAAGTSCAVQDAAVG